MSTYPGQPGPYDPNGQDPYASSPNAGQAYPAQPYPDQQMYNPAAQQSYSGQAGYGAPYGGYAPNPTAKNWMGITSLVLGVLSLCCALFTGIPAIIFGILGINAADKGEANNKGLAIAGIATAVGFTLLNVIATIINGTYSSLLNS